jgi:hypothetical protein
VGNVWFYNHADFGIFIICKQFKNCKWEYSHKVLIKSWWLALILLG